MHLIYDDEAHSPSYLNDVEANVDVNKISQVIRNLVSNAIKFSRRGGTVTVTTSFVPRAQSSKPLSMITSMQSSFDKGLTQNGPSLQAADVDLEAPQGMEVGALHVVVMDSGCGISEVESYDC